MANHLEDMDEELARARDKAGGPGKVVDDDGIDIYKYRRRQRLLKAIVLGVGLAGLVWLIMSMIGGQVNPCEKVRDYLCKKDAAGLPCKSYADIVEESVRDPAPEMRSNIRSQCQSKIERLKEEEGVDIK